MNVAIVLLPPDSTRPTQGQAFGLKQTPSASRKDHAAKRAECLGRLAARILREQLPQKYSRQSRRSY